MGVTSEASQACQAGGHPAFLGFIRASHAPEEETVVRRDVEEEGLVAHFFFFFARGWEHTYEVNRG